MNNYNAGVGKKEGSFFFRGAVGFEREEFFTVWVKQKIFENGIDVD